MKTCKRCGEDKPIGEYTRNSGAKDGLSYYCASCSADLNRERRQNKRDEHARLALVTGPCRCHPSAQGGHKYSDLLLVCDCGKTWFDQMDSPNICPARQDLTQ